MNTYATLNSHRLNQRSAEILSANKIPWSPRIELASVALIRHALEANALEMPTIDEPNLLLARLHAQPQEAMRGMTATDLGEPFEIDLDDDPIQAAAQLLDEIISAPIRQRLSEA